MSTTNYPMSAFSAQDGTRIHYRDIGAGKPLILIHGWAASAAFFERQTPLAAQGLRLIVPDLRGHGASLDARHPLSISLLAADLRALIGHLQLDSFALAGWSMGAMVAWEYLRSFGTGGMDKLSIIDMTARIVTDDEWPYGLTGGYPAAMAPQTAQAILGNWERFSAVSASRLFARNATPEPALLEHFSAIMRATRPEGLASLWLDMARQDYRALLPTLGADCQFIYGKESRLYSPETFARLGQLTGTPHVTGLDDAGHVLHWEQPEAFAAALSAHLARS